MTAVACAVCGVRFDAKSPRARYCSDRCRKRRSRDPEPVSSEPSPESVQVGPGPVEAKTRADVAALVTAHPMGEALAEAAFAMARIVDSYPSLATNANRELRMNLLALAGMGVDGDADLDAALSTPVVPPEVRNPPES